MATSREVITIQCGHYSNFIGAHWWNLQEAGLWSPLLKQEHKNEINYDCTFREGLTLSGKETYTPRLIAIDCPGSLYSLKEDGSLYDVSEVENTPPITWEGPVDVYMNKEIVKNEFLSDLEKINDREIEDDVIEKKSYTMETDVRVWSDYLRPHLHHRTLLTVPGYHHNDKRFNVWPAGQEAWNNKEFLKSFEDRLHFFVEESDYLQGYQLIVDTHPGGFESLASSICEYLNDELGTTKEIFTVLATPTNLSNCELTPLDVIHYTLNSALGLTELLDTSSLLLPVSLFQQLWRTPSQPLDHPSLNYDVSLSYHTSAVLASALETCSSVYRSPLSGGVMSDLTSLLNGQGRKICSLSHSIPFIDQMETSPLSSPSMFSSLFPLTPYSMATPTNDDDMWVQSFCIRGNSFHDNKSHYNSISKLTHLIYKIFPSTNNGVSIYGSPLSIGTPFPVNILTNFTTNSSMSSCTSLSTHSGMARYLSSLCDHTQRINPRLVPSYSSCLEGDVHREIVCKLQDLRDLYRNRTITDNESTDEEN